MFTIIRLDAVSFNFEDMTIPKVCGLLAGGEQLNFTAISRRAMLEGKSLEDCQAVSPAGLFWFPHTGDPVHPYQLQVKGIGCKNFAGVLPVLAHEAGDYHISRIDFAQDYIMSKEKWREICRFADDKGYEDQKAKCYSIQGKGYEKTLYIGSRSSAYYFRVYNKTLEDPDYIYVDADGCEVDVPEGYFVIRYEVEIKRFKRTLRGKSMLIDPTPLFDLYYSDEADKLQQLYEQINDLWLSYGSDILPDDWMLDPVPAWVTQNGDFVQSAKDENYDGIVKMFNVLDCAHGFDKTMRYVVEKFGQYVPYILLRDDLYAICKRRCKSKFSVVPPIEFIDARTEAGYSDLVDADSEIPWEYTLFDI